MFKILMLVQDHTACSYYRAYLPWQECHKDLAREGIQLDLSESINTNNMEYDCYIFHRILADRFWPVLWDMKQNMNKKIIWDLDDNLFHIPSWSSVKEVGDKEKKVLMTCLEWADHITVTTDDFRSQLAAYEGWARKLHVLPNLVSLDDWNFPDNSRVGGRRRILWAGSLTHWGDLEIVVPAIKGIINKYRDKVEFVFMGMMPDALRIAKGNDMNELLRRSVTFLRACDLGYYSQVLNLISPDLAIIPIEDNKFNHAKSNIKYLEMTLAGAVSIASIDGPYGRTINENVDGFLCYNEGYNWAETIDYVMGLNRKELDRISYNAQIKVREKYSWSSESKDIWMNFFRGLAGK